MIWVAGYLLIGFFVTFVGIYLEGKEGEGLDLTAAIIAIAGWPITVAIFARNATR